MTDPRSPKPFRLCVVTPCFNEEEVVAKFVSVLTATLASLPGFSYRIYLVDDGSTDGTFDRIETLAKNDPHIYGISLARNFGHQAALTAGLDAARGDAVIMMDSDLQHPPELIPRMVEKWREGHDIVSAVRRRTADASWLKNFTSDGFYRMLNMLSDTHIRPGAADYCLLSAKALKALRTMPERHRFLRGMVAWMGFRRAFVEFDAPPRFAGRSKYTITKMMRLAFDATMSFSVIPLRIATRMGLFVVILGGVYLAWALLRLFLYQDAVAGWSSLIGCIVVVGGMQLLLVGLLGEYVGRIYEESKGRPLYLVRSRAHYRAKHFGAKPRDTIS